MSPRDRKAYVICVCVSLCVSVLAILRDWQVLRDFSRGAASLAPGTEIRPMGVSLALGIAETAAGFFGFYWVVPALILSWRSRGWSRWLRVALAVLVFAFSLLPVTVGTSEFRHIVKERALVLEE